MSQFLFIFISGMVACLPMQAQAAQPHGLAVSIVGSVGLSCASKMDLCKSRCNAETPLSLLLKFQDLGEHTPVVLAQLAAPAHGLAQPQHRPGTPALPRPSIRGPPQA